MDDIGYVSSYLLESMRLNFCGHTALATHKKTNLISFDDLGAGGRRNGLRCRH